MYRNGVGPLVSQQWGSLRKKGELKNAGVLKTRSSSSEEYKKGGETVEL